MALTKSIQFEIDLDDCELTTQFSELLVELDEYSIKGVGYDKKLSLLTITVEN